MQCPIESSVTGLGVLRLDGTTRKPGGFHLRAAGTPTGARHGAFLTLSDSAWVESLPPSGSASEETVRLRKATEGLGILGYMRETEGPLRRR